MQLFVSPSPLFASRRSLLGSVHALLRFWRGFPSVLTIETPISPSYGLPLCVVRLPFHYCRNFFSGVKSFSHADGGLNNTSEALIPVPIVPVGLVKNMLRPVKPFLVLVIEYFCGIEGG